MPFAICPLYHFLHPQFPLTILQQMYWSLFIGPTICWPTLHFYWYFKFVQIYTFVHSIHLFFQAGTSPCFICGHLHNNKVNHNMAADRMPFLIPHLSSTVTSCERCYFGVITWRNNLSFVDSKMTYNLWDQQTKGLYKVTWLLIKLQLLLCRYILSFLPQTMSKNGSPCQM